MQWNVTGFKYVCPIVYYINIIHIITLFQSMSMKQQMKYLIRTSNALTMAI